MEIDTPKKRGREEGESGKLVTKKRQSFNKNNTHW
jgi:hypothetical protein